MPNDLVGQSTEVARCLDVRSGQASRFLVLAGGQAVVELAEEAVEQVAQHGRVPVTSRAAAVVVGLRAG